MLGIFAELGIDNMTIADGALREGVMYDLMGRKRDDDLRESTVSYLKKRYSLDFAQGERIANLSSYLYHQFLGNDKPNLEQLKLLMWACELYEIGMRISHNDYHKHGSYILQNSDLAGFSKPEQTIIADLVRTHRGSVIKLLIKLNKSYKDKIKPRVIFSLIAFRLSVIFNRSRKDIDFSKVIKIDSVSQIGFNLNIDHNWLINNPLTLYSINEEIQQWLQQGYVVNLVKCKL